MNVITTTNIIFKGKVYPEGHKFTDLTDKQCASLISQGVAKKATRVVEVDDDEQTPVREAKVPAEALTAAQEGRPPVSKDMTRDALDAIAEAEGMTELEQYGTKAELVQAINEHREATN